MTHHFGATIKVYPSAYLPEPWPAYGPRRPSADKPKRLPTLDDLPSISGLGAQGDSPNILFSNQGN